MEEEKEQREVVKNEDEKISKHFESIKMIMDLSSKFVAKNLLTNEKVVDKFHRLPENEEIDNEMLFRLYYFANESLKFAHEKGYRYRSAERLKNACAKEIETRAKHYNLPL